MIPLDYKASSELRGKPIQFDCIMDFNLRFLLSEYLVSVPCLFSDILDGYRPMASAQMGQSVSLNIAL